MVFFSAADAGRALFGLIGIIAVLTNRVVVSQSGSASERTEVDVTNQGLFRRRIPGHSDHSDVN